MAREIGDEAFAAPVPAPRRPRRSKNLDPAALERVVRLLHPAARSAHAKPSARMTAARSIRCSARLGVPGGPGTHPGRRSHVSRALQSLWTYNFTPDVGPYRQVHKPGRWYAMAGEGGPAHVHLARKATAPRSSPAGLRLLLQRVHERLRVPGRRPHDLGGDGPGGPGDHPRRSTTATMPRRRNPWNEVECGDHYARSMASYGVFLAACGYEYHGPAVSWPSPRGSGPMISAPPSPRPRAGERFPREGCGVPGGHTGHPDGNPDAETVASLTLQEGFRPRTAEASLPEKPALT